jgi:hypothetical protein
MIELVTGEIVPIPVDDFLPFIGDCVPPAPVANIPAYKNRSIHFRRDLFFFDPYKRIPFICFRTKPIRTHSNHKVEERKNVFDRAGIIKIHIQ